MKKYLMTKEEDKVVLVTQEVTTTNNSNIEYVSQESLQTPDYSYGLTNEPLNYEVAIRDKPNMRRFLLLS